MLRPPLLLFRWAGRAGLSASAVRARSNVKYVLEMQARGRPDERLLPKWQSRQVTAKMEQRTANADAAWWTARVKEDAGIAASLDQDRPLSEAEAAKVADVLSADSRIAHMRFLTIAEQKGLSSAALSYGIYLERSGKGNVATTRETVASAFRHWLDGERQPLPPDLHQTMIESTLRQTREEYAPLRGTGVRLLVMSGDWAGGWTFAGECLGPAESEERSSEGRREVAQWLSAVAVGAAEKGAWDVVWELLEDLRLRGCYSPLSNKTFELLLRLAGSRGTPEEALTRLGRLVNATAGLRQGLRGAEARPFAEAVKAAVERGGWDLKADEGAFVERSGQCRTCGGGLEANPLSEAELSRLREAVFQDVMAREEDWSRYFRGDFNGFRRLMAGSGEFDLIIDGLNLFYWGPRRTKKSKTTREEIWEQTEARTERVGVALRELRKMGYQRALFIARRHVTSTLAKPLGEATADDWLTTFFTSNQVTDDAFFLMAALASPKAHLCTADFLSMEASKLGIRERSDLLRWMESSMLRLIPWYPGAYGNDITKFLIPPPKHTTAPQARVLENGDLRFHVPYSDVDLRLGDLAQDWLCLRVSGVGKGRVDLPLLKHRSTPPAKPSLAKAPPRLQTKPWLGRQARRDDELKDEKLRVASRTWHQHMNAAIKRQRESQAMEDPWPKPI